MPDEQKPCDHKVDQAYIDKYRRQRQWKGKAVTWLGCPKCNTTFLHQQPLVQHESGDPVNTA